MHIQCQHLNSPAVWGSHIYTDDSSLATAVIHAGLLTEGQSGIINVTLLPGRNAYPSEQRNGITSSTWGNWGSSYMLELEEKISVEPRITDAPVTMAAIKGEDGDSFTFTITGANSGAVWGNGIYTTDSNLAAAAVHAGLLKPGETGKVKVTLLPGRNNYQGSSQNGVETGSWGPYPRSFMIDTPEPATIQEFKGYRPGYILDVF